MKHSLAVARISMTYSWYNIGPEFKNNTFKCSSDNGNNWRTITFPSGVYSFSDIESFIAKALRADGKIQISFNISKFHTFLNLASDYQVDFRNTKFADLLGFDEKIITTSEEGSRPPNITRSVDSIHICSNTVTNKSLVDGKIGNTLFTFSTNVLNRARPFDKEPLHLNFVEVADNYFDEMEIQVKDDKGELVDLNGVDWNMTLILKSV